MKPDDEANHTRKGEKTLMVVGFTEALYNKLKENGATDEELRTLSEIVVEIPRGEYDIDTSDGKVVCRGEPVSFIRDFKKGEVILLTRAEAKALDGAN